MPQISPIHTHDTMCMVRRCYQKIQRTYNETFIPNRSRKIAIKCDLIIVWVISLVRDYVVIQCGLMSQNLR